MAGEGVAKKVAGKTPAGRAAKVAGKAAGAVAGRRKPGGGTWSKSDPSRWLLAELLVCLLLIGLNALAGQMGDDADAQAMGSHLAVRGSALCGVFIILGLVSAGGRGAAKFAGAVGLLITLAYVLNEGPTYKQIAAWATDQSGGGK